MRNLAGKMAEDSIESNKELRRGRRKRAAEVVGGENA